ncbi:RNA-guided pseudouridylation complex pseudouridine synthase subunit Cbf5 [Candidatus Woesearchaeota archaeon]|nr:RNA-guided pseudouridylation complex pseudouridine synthase subunit Cbf5 [Candidatus Woesearchaeota archaeon]
MEGLPFERIKREKLVRKEAETSSRFGKRPEERTVEELLELGIININKPKGPTSHQVSAYVQKILGIKKSGHSGTLDPKVTGVLPIALGRGTRIVQALLPAGKEYIAIMHLHKEAEEEDIRKVCKGFVGKIKQLPPIKSSVKRQWRYRKVYYLDMMEIGDKDVLMRIGCQAGTYIRKLIHDIGQKAGAGAHMAELVRTKAGPFSDDSMWTLQDLTDAFWYWKHEGNDKFIRKVIQPVEAGVGHLPKVWVLDTTVDSMSHGADLKVPGINAVESDIQVGEPVAVMTIKDELIGFGDARMISKDMVKKEKGVAVKIHKVFMQPGIYPRVER